jgi:hypothetical protein
MGVRRYIIFAYNYEIFSSKERNMAVNKDLSTISGLLISARA